MDIRERLEERYQEREALKRRLAQEDRPERKSVASKKVKPDISKYVTGSYVPTPNGEIFVARHTYDLDHKHGGQQLDKVFEITGENAGVVDSTSEGWKFDLSRMLFLDTETTGLAGGTGTVAFMIGIGFFFENKYIVEQYFMRDYDEEEEMLNLLAERSKGYDAVVTFNGRTFDLPLIETRMLMNRQDPALSRLRSIDLLHGSRRIWSLRLDNCRLGTLEEEVLGFTRAENDVPGSLIPGIYFDFIQNGNADPLYKVFYHNEKDVVSMVGLTYLVFRQLSNPLEEASGNPLDLYNIGKHYERTRRWSMATACLGEASKNLSGAVKIDSLLRLSLLYKKEDKWDEAVEIWKEIISGSNPFYLLPYVELAKHNEHRSKDYEAALGLTETAIGKLSERRRADIEALEHRKKRLERKIAKEKSGK